MIKFSIPDFWVHYKLNLLFIDLFQSQRNKFFDDVEIDSIYGSFPCIWNGGRIVPGYTSGINIENTLKAFNQRGIGIRFTFTNSLLQPEHLSDCLGNQILQLGHSTKNSVNISSPLMKEYIQTHYPKYYILYSTTMGIIDIAKINELSKDNIVVLDYSLNNNFELLKQLQYPENIEILCSELCIDGCPYREEHYRSISQHNLFQTVEPYQCKFSRYGLSYYNTLTTNRSYVSLDCIREKYLPLGINKFKLNGRGEQTINVIERYINYFVKPEYKNDIRNQLLIRYYCLT